jgi:hypothetical protein
MARGGDGLPTVPAVRKEALRLRRGAFSLSGSGGTEPTEQTEPQAAGSAIHPKGLPWRPAIG